MIICQTLGQKIKVVFIDFGVNSRFARFWGEWTPKVTLLSCLLLKYIFGLVEDQRLPDTFFLHSVYKVFPIFCVSVQDHQYSEELNIWFCLQGVEKGCVEKEWVKQNRLNFVENSVFLEICESDFSDFYINTTGYQYSKSLIS